MQKNFWVGLKSLVGNSIFPYFRILKLSDVRFYMYREKISAKVGSYSYGEIKVYSYSVGGEIQIGNFCSIGELTVIIGGEHHRGLTTFPFKAKVLNEKINNDNFPPKGIRIGHDVWIGNDVTILDGVNIGTGSIIGAGAFIRKDVSPYSIIFGNPQQLIRYRYDSQTISQIMDSDWFNLPIDFLIENLDTLYSDDVKTFISKIKEFNK